MILSALWGGGQLEPQNSGLCGHRPIRDQTANELAEDDESDERPSLIPSILALTCCYEVLQLQLYLKGGCPIYYAVPEDILEARRPALVDGGKATGDYWDEMCTFLREQSSGQVARSGESAEAMST